MLAAAFKDAAFVLGGFSLGGYVLFRYVARFGGGIARLMLLGHAGGGRYLRRPCAPCRGHRAHCGGGGAGFLDEFLTLILSPRTLESRPAVAAELRGILRAATASVLIAALGAMADRPDSTPMLPEVAVPTLIVVGEEDRVTPPESSRRVHAAIRGSTLVTVPNAGHTSNLEQPERFNAALLELLRGPR